MSLCVYLGGHQETHEEHWQNRAENISHIEACLFERYQHFDRIYTIHLTVIWPDGAKEVISYKRRPIHVTSADSIKASTISVYCTLEGEGGRRLENMLNIIVIRG